MRDFQLDPMTTEKIRLRSEFLNTQVITRDNGKRLGVIKDLLVDIDQREVVALGLRDNALSVAGMPRYMYLNSIRQSFQTMLTFIPTSFLVSSLWRENPQAKALTDFHKPQTMAPRTGPISEK